MSKPNPQIAFFIHSLNCGGVEKHTLNLIHNFVKKDFKVDLLLRSVQGEYLSQLPPQIRIIELGNGFKGLFNLINYLKKEQPLNLLSAMYPINEMAILAKYLTKSTFRIVVSVHTILSAQENIIQFRWAVLSKIHAHWVKLLARWFYPYADDIVIVSQAAAKDFVQVTDIPLSRIQVIYNSVITPELLEKSKQSLDHPWFKRGEPPVILAVGRLNYVKDFPTLIRAFAIVRQLQPARLMILGAGLDEKLLKALICELGIEQDVMLPGFTDNPYVYMAASSVLVLSSLTESLSNVIVEAIALGTPVVSTDCPSGPKEILADGKYGELVPVGDSQAMAEAIKWVLSGNIKSVDPAWLEQFSVATVIQKYIDLFNFPTEGV